MTAKQLVIYPNERLRQISEPVEDFGEELQELIQDMTDTLKAFKAHGLAAIQIGVPKRVFMVSDAESAEEVRVFVNPKITLDPGTILWREGCLSFPMAFGKVPRAEGITITAQDATGKEFTLCSDGFDGVAIQHEYDHLDGILFIDRAGPVNKRFMLKDLKKWRKTYGR